MANRGSRNHSDQEYKVLKRARGRIKSGKAFRFDRDIVWDTDWNFLGERRLNWYGGELPRANRSIDSSRSCAVSEMVCCKTTLSKAPSSSMSNADHAVFYQPTHLSGQESL
jgi:hypothetical protein